MRPGIVLLLVLAQFLGCGGEEPATQNDLPSDAQAPTDPNGETEPRLLRVLVDQILISFRDARVEKYRNASRTREQAEALAKSLLARVKAGVDFHALKQEYSDVRGRNHPFYVANKGFRPIASRDGFGHVAYENYYAIPRKLVFGLEVGEVGLAPYHEKNCPEGYFVIRRLQ